MTVGERDFLDLAAVADRGCFRDGLIQLIECGGIAHSVLSAVSAGQLLR
jgi:hypothetical protein